MTSSADGANGAAAFDPCHDESQLERLTFFSDAVFAIAMTLLVIEVRLPDGHYANSGELGQALLGIAPHYLGYLSSFLVIGRFWIGHHQLFGLLEGTSNRLLWVNLAFLLAVAFMPFPTAVLSEHAVLRLGAGFYAAWLALIGLANVWIVRVALAGPLVKPGIAPAMLRARRRNAWIPVVLGALAFGAAMVAPLGALVALAVGSPIVGIAFGRWRRTDEARSAEADAGAGVAGQPPG